MEEPTATTNSGDQDERIRARRTRIEKRNISRNEEGQKSGGGDPEEKQKSRRKQQVANSLVRLDKKKANTIESVTSIRVEADHSENARRIHEEEKRQRRLHSLQGEALSSGKKNAAVEMRWAELMEYNMPLELDAEVAKQRKACEDIIKSKDKLIKDFQRELKIKDEEYVKSLKRQGEDIEQLLARMASQYKELQHQYEEELEAIEDAFLQERKELIESNRAETDALFEKRRVMEMNYMESRQEREANYQKELTELRTKDAEDYNQLKIKLETDIQTLEQQLEEMRATYQMNTEKLDYNYRVLTERDMENSATLGQQKRKLARLKEALSTITAKYQSTDAKYKQENMELTEEYRRITKQYKDLQAKFRHFEIADNRKYREIWEMHREEVLEQVSQLLSADKLIQEQQLGLAWRAPPPEALQCSSATFAAPKAPSSPVSPQAATTPSKPAPPATASPTDAKPDSTSDRDAAGPATGPDPSLGMPDQEAAHGEAHSRSAVVDAKVRYLLEMLSAEAGFLVDSEAKAAAAETEDAAKAAIIRADSILKALSVESESELLTLLGYFYERVDDDEEDAFALERAADREAELKSLGLKVKADQVVKVIKQFVRDRNAEGDDAFSALPSATKGSRKKKREDLVDEEQRASDARRERDRQEEIEYWSRLASIVPDRSVRVWEALEQAMQKYNSVLQERAETIREVAVLKAQNDELKGLLNQYLSSDAVQTLIVPPLETTLGPDAAGPAAAPRNLYRN